MKVLDLSLAVKHDHPDIQKGKTYLCKIYGKWFFGTFSRQWFGWSFNGWYNHLQFDAPGYNSSQWEAVVEFDPEVFLKETTHGAFLRRCREWAALERKHNA